jgi:uncharacterized protein YndB with AHSA1/START domain
MEETRITRSIELDAPVGDVWRALTDPALLSDWLEGDVELDVRPGGGGTIVEPDGAVRRAVVDDVEPLRRLALRWWPEDDSAPASIVEFELAPAAGDGPTTLVVTETLAAAAPVARAQADFRWAVRSLLLGCVLLRAAVACR